MINDKRNWSLSEALAFLLVSNIFLYLSHHIMFFQFDFDNRYLIFCDDFLRPKVVRVFGLDLEITTSLLCEIWFCRGMVSLRKPLNVQESYNVLEKKTEIRYTEIA